MHNTLDERFMQMALGLARRGLGVVAPNPAVGCVIVQEGQVVGRGWTADAGRPHAETIALERAGVRAKGATAYVTLEPCSHEGKTPPCTKALIEAEVRRMVIATQDPNPKVNGQGIAQLRDAGIEVELGMCEEEARAINQGFLDTITQQMPFVTLKCATTQDGFIAPVSGERMQITGEEAMAYAHLLRKQHDAILVGIGTVLADDPLLTCRLPGLENFSPVRIILDSQLKISEESKIIQTAEKTSTWIFTLSDAPAEKIEKLKYYGSEIIFGEKDKNGQISLKKALNEISARGITRLLVEGGSALASSFVLNSYESEMIWLRSRNMIKEGIPAISGKNILELENDPNFEKIAERHLGQDELLKFHSGSGTEEK